MPWYEYVCDACGKVVERNCSIAHRDVTPLHTDEGGCGGGRLRLHGPALRPAAARPPGGRRGPRDPDAPPGSRRPAK